MGPGVGIFADVGALSNVRFAPEAAIRQLMSFYIFACQFVD
jgi:hypothetical protein